VVATALALPTMRVAEIAPVWFPVPPRGYGGIEAVVALLADGLVAGGHDVTLFASGGSRTRAKLVSPLEAPPDPAVLGNPWFDALHAVSAYQELDGFDVVHDHSGIVGAALGAMRRGGPPVVHTLHGPWTDVSRRYYGLLADSIHLVAISESQRSDNMGIRYAGVVPNGIDVDAYTYREAKDDYLVFIGRANPEKGVALAIDVARRAGLPLKMIVKRSEPPEVAYWMNTVAPTLGSDEEVFQDVTHDEKVELLAGARAMVFPIQWAEPFGLVMAEAMACGTPVVTTNWGAAVELVDDGVTGFRRDTVEDLAAAVHRVHEISARACRGRVEERFSATAMVSGYERLFERILAGA
jgi:glycosyltransferase involved in cell wall biosynthesis